MFDSKERFSSVPSRDGQVAKAQEDAKNVSALSDQELAQLSQETREFFNLCLPSSKVSEAGLELAA